MIKLLPKNIKYLAAFSILIAVLTSLSFYFFAIFLQVFLLIIGFIDEAKVSEKLIFLQNKEILFLIIFSIIIFLQGFFQFLQIYIKRIFNESLIYETRKKFFEIFFSEEDKWKFDISQSSNIISEVIPKNASYVGSQVQLISLFVQLFAITCFCLIESYSKFFLVLFGLSFIYPVFYYYNNKFKTLSGEILNLSNRFNKQLIRSVVNFPFIKIISKEEKEKKLLSDSAKNYFIKFRKTMYFLSAGSSLPQAIGSVIIILIFFFISKGNDVNYLVLFYMLYKFTGTLQQIIASYHNMDVYKSHHELLKEIVEKISFKKDEITYDKKNIENIDKFENILRLNNFSFSYEGKDSTSQKIINNINIDLKKNESLIIKGESGSGKSTLLMCLIGILKTSDKQIYWKDCDISLIDLKKFRKNIAYVGPEPFLISGTIKENIFFGLENDQIKEIDDNKILEICKKANAFDFIDSAKDKLETKIDEYGGGLSMGQKQRICLARALIKKPQVIIFDEMTANLDRENELVIVENLKKLKKEVTLIIATHSDFFNNMADKTINLTIQNKSK